MSKPNNKRPSGLFISFNDGSDPTCASLEDCLIVRGYDDEQNPCNDDNLIEACPVKPKNIDELEMFAKMMGWRLEFDDDGKAVLHTEIEMEKEPYSC